MALAARVQAFEHPVQQGPGRRWLFVGVADAQSAAQVQVRDLDAVLVQLFNQIQQFFKRIEIGTDVGELGADVAIDAHDVQAAQRLGGAVDVQR
ncbi:hypothetical protein D3C85_1665270 [compost metagenome]